MTIASSTVTTGTSSPSGYTLYLQMTGENSTTNSLINSVDATATLTSSGSFVSPTVLTNGTWGYAIPSGSTSLLNTNGFDDSYTEVESVAQTGSKFAAIPTTNSPAEKIAETNSPSVVELPVYYAAMASYDTISGTYSNKVLYTALADDGATDLIAVAPSIVDVNTSTDILVATALYSTSDTASANIYLLTEDEYSSISGTNVEALGVSPLSCTVTDTAPHSYTCTLPAITSLGDYYIYVKYPNYDRVYSTTITVTSTAPLMQTFTPAMCDSMSIGESTTLQDTRDWSTYSVAKLADGNCWMTQNLRLGDGTKSYTLTPDDSNVATNFTLPVAQTSGSTSWGDAANTGNDPHVYATGNETYGNYYNWYTATAGTGKGTMQSTSTTNLDNAASSICPKGWRLPDGGESPVGSFYALDIALGGNGTDRIDATQRNKYLASPYLFPYSGYYDIANGVDRQGSNGNWWTRGAHTTTGRAYRFHLNTDGYVSSQSGANVGSGISVRCLLSDFWNISTMQDMTPQVAASVATPTTSATSAVTDRAAYNTLVDKTSNVPQRTLYDIRDGETYRVRKLADGNVWMTENLRLVGSRTLTPSDSSISTDYILPASSTSGWCTDRTEACMDIQNVLDTGNTSYGVYYSWAAATAGTGPSFGYAMSSICPKGWYLPAGDTSGEFQNLSDAGYNTTAKMQGTDGTIGPEFVLSGLRSGSSTASQGSYGYYWSGTAGSDLITYDLTLDSSSVRRAGDWKYYGFSVRCVGE